MKTEQWLLTAVVFIFVGLLSGSANGEEKKKSASQYKHKEIDIPGARADEPVRPTVSVKHAADYIEQGALAWSRQRNCVSCHTNGSYMRIRPALTSQLGKPSEEIRTFYVSQLGKLKALGRKKLLSGIKPTQVAYVAAGLAEWDAHVTKTLSPQTDAALRLMFDVQSENGGWGNTDCWPPFESSSYHGTTVAAMAAATAPGWLKSLDDDTLKAGVAKMKTYLRTTKPPHDYARVLLLWTATRIPDLLDESQKTQLIETVWKRQQKDGGWSIRTFAKPESWGGGNRAKKLRSEPDFNNPPSDGHQTGLAVLVLRDAGISADDPRIQKAVKWLLANQRTSGRWWTRSLNTDRFHFITYSGTTYPLLALSKCNALPPLENKTAAK